MSTRRSSSNPCQCASLLPSFRRDALSGHRSAVPNCSLTSAASTSCSRRYSLCSASLTHDMMSEPRGRLLTKNWSAMTSSTSEALSTKRRSDGRLGGERGQTGRRAEALLVGSWRAAASNAPLSQVRLGSRLQRSRAQDELGRAWCAQGEASGLRLHSCRAAWKLEGRGSDGHAAAALPPLCERRTRTHRASAHDMATRRLPGAGSSRCVMIMDGRSGPRTRLRCPWAVATGQSLLWPLALSVECGGGGWAPAVLGAALRHRMGALPSGAKRSGGARR